MNKPYPILFFVVAVVFAIGLMFWSMGETHGPSRDASYQAQSSGSRTSQPGVPLPPEGKRDQSR
jgi:hypothetical protein